MKRVFLEPNAINRIVDSGCTGPEFRTLLFNSGWLPVVGIHCIYEMARGYLSGARDDRIAAQFVVLRELDADIVKPFDMMMAEEGTKFMTGAVVDPFLSGNHLKRAQDELRRLASGVLSGRGREFLVKREAEIEAHLPALAVPAIAQFQKAKRNHPEELGACRCYEDIYALLEPEFPKIISQIEGAAIDFNTAKLVAKRLDDFPCLKTAVRAHVYINFVCWVHGAIPGKDKLDDPRHVMDAAYCDSFVTKDRQLFRNLCYYNPDLDGLWWDEFWESLTVV